MRSASRTSSPNLTALRSRIPLHPRPGAARSRQRVLRSERRRYHRQVAEAFEALSQAVTATSRSWPSIGRKAASRCVRPFTSCSPVIGRASWVQRRSHRALPQGDGTHRRVRDPSAPISPYLLHERLGDVYLENLSDQDQARIRLHRLPCCSRRSAGSRRGRAQLASIDMLQGDLVEAKMNFERALAACPVCRMIRRAIGALRPGLPLHFPRRYGPGGRLRSRASVWRAAIGDLRGLAELYRQRGLIADIQGQPGWLRAYARRYLKLYEQLRTAAVAQAHNNVAVGYRQLGRFGRRTPSSGGTRAGPAHRRHPRSGAAAAQSRRSCCWIKDWQTKPSKRCWKRCRWRSLPALSHV